MKNKKNTGFTLTETAIVLLLISLVLGAVWAATGSVQQKAAVNQMIQNVSQIASNVSETYTGFPKAVVPIAFADKIKLFPSNILNAAKNDTTNPWGGKYNLDFFSNAGSIRGFSVELTLPNTIEVSYSQKICFDGATLLYGTGKNMALYSSLISNIPVRNPTQGFGPTNVFLNGDDITGFGVKGMIDKLGAVGCTSLRFYYPL